MAERVCLCHDKMFLQLFFLRIFFCLASRNSTLKQDKPQAPGLTRSRRSSQGTLNGNNADNARVRASSGSDESDDDRGSQRSQRSQKSQRSVPTRRNRLDSDASMRQTQLRTSADGEQEKEKEKEKSTRRMSVAGWASAVAGLSIGRQKEKFSELNDDDTSFQSDNGGDQDKAKRSNNKDGLSKTPPLPVKPKSRSKSNSLTGSLGSSFSSSPARILRPLALQGKKVVRAVKDFSGSADELTFKVGDEIVVVNEVVDDWWMGSLDGRQGLFPTSFVEAIDSRERKVFGDVSSDDDSLHIAQGSLKGDESETSEIDDFHFRRPLDINNETVIFFGHSQMSSTGADEGPNVIPPPPMLSVRSQSNPVNVGNGSSTVKRTRPPPPPPRRSTPNLQSAAAGDLTSSLPKGRPLSLAVPTIQQGRSPFDDTDALIAPEAMGSGWLSVGFNQGKGSNPFGPDPRRE
jgi:hypothetical protein